MRQVDAALLDGRPRRVAVLSTAAAPEGEASLSRWHRLAREHYAALESETVVVDVRTRADADDQEMAALIADVGLVYLSGGNPGFLADTLRGTAVGERIADAWRTGTAVAGCSAGAMALGARTLSPRGGVHDGLGLAGPLAIIPHFDAFGLAGRLAGRLAGLSRAARDLTVVGVDENTAVVHRAGQGWTVEGASRTWILHRGDRTPYGRGEQVPLPDPPGTPEVRPR